MKKLLLTIMGMLIAIPAALARDFTYTYEGQTLTYTVLDEDHKLCTTKQGTEGTPGNYVSGDLRLPKYVMDGDIAYTLYNIKEYSFTNCTQLTSVSIANNLEFVGKGAFNGCTALKELIFESENATFVNENSIEDYIYETVTLTIPENAIMDYLSYGWSKFKSIKYIGSQNPLIRWSDGVFTYLCNSADHNAILLKPDDSGIITASIPERFYASDTDSERYYVKAIGPRAFMDCKSLTAINFNSRIQLETICEDAFNGCIGLQSIAIPKTVSSIGWNAFKGCTGLTAVHITDLAAWCKIKYDSHYYFNANPLELGENLYINGELATNIIIPKTVTEIGVNVFAGCNSLRSVVIPNTVTKICDRAFSGCFYLSKLYLPESITEIGNAFQGCYLLREVYISDVAAWCGITFSSYYSSSNPLVQAKHLYLGDSEIKNLIIPEGVTTIKNYVFNNCVGLESVEFPNSLINIGNSAFENCSSLTSVDFRDSISEIGNSCFSGCSNLRSITLPNSLQSIASYAFNGCSKLDSVVIGESVNNIGSFAFKDCSKLSYVSIPNSVNSIEWGGFRNCTNLRTITIPNSVKNIGPLAFNGCYNLEHLAIGGGLSSITEDNVFENCRSLKDLIILDGPDGVAVDSCVFINCPITSLHIGRDINADAFSSHKQIETLSFGNTVTQIPDKAFNGFTALKSLTFGSSIAAIGDSAFRNCALTEIVVPSSVESIGDYAFAGCQLSNVTIGSGMTSVGQKAFDGAPANAVYITAPEPPTAYANTFSDYSGTLYVADAAAVERYYDARACWDRFDGYAMIEPERLEISSEPLNFVAGSTQQLKATVYPENTTLKHVFWHSTNPEVATVDANGLVTFQKQIPQGGAAVLASRAAEVAGCKIIASTLYADGPVAEFDVNGAYASIGRVDADERGDAQAIDFTKPVEVYNLQGIRVGESMKDLPCGIYVVRQGAAVQKIAVR